MQKYKCVLFLLTIFIIHKNILTQLYIEIQGKDLVLSYTTLLYTVNKVPSPALFLGFHLSTDLRPDRIGFPAKASLQYFYIIFPDSELAVQK